MAKKPNSVETNSPAAAGASIRNRPLERFLLRLAVQEDFREEYQASSPEQRRARLREEFAMGRGTIDAVVTGSEGTVKARFGLSDQTGSNPVAPPRKAAKGSSGSAKKR